MNFQFSWCFERLLKWKLINNNNMKKNFITILLLIFAQVAWG